MTQMAYAPAADGWAIPATPSYGDASAGVAAEDLFYYPLRNVTLERGRVGYFGLFSAEVPYAHIYTWDIPDYVDQNDYYRAEEESQPEIVWHNLELENTIMAHPKVMLLDEPSLGLSPVLVREIFKIARRINQEEKTSILLVEQNAVAALSVAEYGYVMENGKVVLDGPTPKLKDNEDIKEFYLGLSGVGQRKSYREVKHYKRRKRWLG